MDLGRYEKHVLLEEIGEEGQRKLMKSSAAIIGCGALGGMIASLLARAGIGKLIVVDRDFVEMKNLHRQILFDEEDAVNMTPKAVAAMEKLRKMNSSIEVEAMVVDVNPSNVEEIVESVDIIMDGTDNLETRFLINDACIKHNKPWVYGAVVETEGMTMGIVPHETACLRCFLPFAPGGNTCDTSGVLSMAATTIASLQATEAIRILVGEGARGEAIHLDVWSGGVVPIKVERNPECVACGKGEYEFLDSSRYSSARILCDGKTVQIIPGSPIPSLQKLAERLERVGKVERGRHVLKFRTEKEEMIIFEDGRALITNAGSVERAKALYAKYVGI